MNPLPANRDYINFNQRITDAGDPATYQSLYDENKNQVNENPAAFDSTSVQLIASDCRDAIKNLRGLKSELPGLHPRFLTEQEVAELNARIDKNITDFKDVRDKSEKLEADLANQCCIIL